MRVVRIVVATVLLAAALPASTQTPDGAELFGAQCALCHENPPDKAIPARAALAALTPDAIVESLTDGTMRLQGQPLAAGDRIAIAEFLTGRRASAPVLASVAGRCLNPAAMTRPAADAHWNGWGPDTHNSRYQAVTGGLTADTVPKLTLKWAFGIPDTTQSRAQPAIVGGRLFVASQSGLVFALNAKSGCTIWTFKADAGIRTAISVGPIGPDRQATYFADAAATAWALDAQTGAKIWSHKVDEHPAARATGAPTLHDGRLYVPMAGVAEEMAASGPDYGCCTFRGSITALDAATGELIWKTFSVPESQPRGKSTTGVTLYGPAGASIWSAPTVDVKRGLLYASTGNTYADPAQPTSDAVIALRLATGEMVWSQQPAGGDAWIMGCDATSDSPSCPDEVGQDFDFSASPVLTSTAGGRELIVIPQKSGMGYALDPDRQGALVWQYRWGRGSPVGGVWGAAVDGRQAYFAVADQRTPAPGGLHAVDLLTGQRVWYAPPQPPLCGSQQNCTSAQSAAVTAIPGVVFSGSADGGIRAYAATTGAVIWTFDTNRNFETVNGVKANGGSIDGPGAVVAGGMLYVTSGNGGFGSRPGNVLLAFAVEN